jgi:hypothetical protein
MKTADKIRALPWKGNAGDDLITRGGVKSTYDIANDLILHEPDNDEAWEAEKALNWCCFGEEIGDESRREWEHRSMRQ